MIAGAELYETLSRHLGRGRMDENGLADLAALGGLATPAPVPLRLWRVVTVPADKWASLSSGQTVTLDPRTHDCWSMSRISICPILRLRADLALSRDEVCLLLDRQFSDETPVLDVERLARSLGMDAHGGVTWNVYAGAEREVIVSNPGGVVSISPADVAGAWGRDVGDHHLLWDPMPGEPYAATDGDLVIESHMGSCEDTGCAIVRCSDGRRHRAVFEAGMWCSGADPDMPFSDFEP